MRKRDYTWTPIREEKADNFFFFLMFSVNGVKERVKNINKSVINHLEFLKNLSLMTYKITVFAVYFVFLKPRWQFFQLPFFPSLYKGMASKEGVFVLHD